MTYMKFSEVKSGFLFKFNVLYMRGKYMKIYRILLCLYALFLLNGCTTLNHGTFVSSTYIEPNDRIEKQLIGEVKGESSQIWLLYIFPIGESPSTNKAILDAKSKFAGTKYLADMSIENEIYWGIGYKKQLIEVEAMAYK